MHTVVLSIIVIFPKEKKMLVKIEFTIDTDNPQDKRHIMDAMEKLESLLEMVDDYMYEPEPEPVKRKPYPKKNTRKS
jgi:hypothetical protein